MDVVRHDELERIALEVRKDVVRMLGVARARGLSEAIGIVDILVYLYWEYMKIYPDRRNWPDRDRLVLGKGSAAPALYACLARKGFFSREDLWNYSRLGAMLQGYPDIRTPGVDTPWASWGGGIGIAAGLCVYLRSKGIGAKVFCVMDETEMCSEVALRSSASAGSDRLGGLILIIEARSGSGAARSALDSAGWIVTTSDGGDFLSMEKALNELSGASSVPVALIAETVPWGSRVFPFLDVTAYGHHMSRFDMDNVLSQLEKGCNDAESGR